MMNNWVSTSTTDCTVSCCLPAFAHKSSPGRSWHCHRHLVYSWRHSLSPSLCPLTATIQSPSLWPAGHHCFPGKQNPMLQHTYRSNSSLLLTAVSLSLLAVTVWVLLMYYYRSLNHIFYIKHKNTLSFSKHRKHPGCYCYVCTEEAEVSKIEKILMVWLTLVL